MLSAAINRTRVHDTRDDYTRSMNFDALDSDAFARQGSYTKRINRDVYSTIDPTTPPLSQSGKIVVVTGASSGIGARGIAPGFAKAGARAIILVGRRADKLAETASTIRQQFPSTEVVEAAINISDAQAVETLFSSVSASLGSPNVLVNNAGVKSEFASMAASDPIKWWNDFETNIRGTYLFSRAFLKSLGPDSQGYIINLSAAAATMARASDSSYGISKGAVNKLTEYTALENPNVQCVALDPGSVVTDAIPPQFLKFARDTPELVGGTAVWLSTPAAAFLNGRFMRANWSVDDLIERKNEVIQGNDLKMMLQGSFGTGAE